MNKVCCVLLAASLMLLLVAPSAATTDDGEGKPLQEKNLYIISPVDGGEVAPDPPFNLEEITEEEYQRRMESSSGDEGGPLGIDDDIEGGYEDLIDLYGIDGAAKEYEETRSVAVGSIHSTVALIAFLLNTLVMVAAGRHLRANQSFLVRCLCGSSLLLVVTLVASATERLTATWLFGTALCTVNQWLKVFGVSLQVYFATLIAVELFFHLRLPSFNRSMERRGGARLKAALVLFGSLLGFVVSYPAFTRAKTVDLGLSTVRCTLTSYEPLDSFDYAFEVTKGGDIVITGSGAGDAIANMLNYGDGGDDMAEWDDNDNCNWHHTSFHFTFWIVSIACFQYFVPLAVVASLFVAVKAKTGGGDGKLASPIVRAQSCWTWTAVWTCFVCWTPTNVFKVARVVGIPVPMSTCTHLEDFGFVLGYFSCLALPTVLVFYLMRMRARCHGNDDDEEKKTAPSSHVTNVSDEEHGLMSNRSE